MNLPPPKRTTMHGEANTVTERRTEYQLIAQGLFPAAEVMDAPGRKPKPRKDTGTKSMNVGNHLIIHIYADGTGGGEAPLQLARMELLESSSRRFAAEMRKRCDFIDAWLALPKRTDVELRA